MATSSHGCCACARTPPHHLRQLRPARRNSPTKNSPAGWRGSRPGHVWADVDALRTVWKGPLVLKGIIHPLEAAEAVARGVDGVVVSNHGGRQLDGAAASIDALPAVVAAVDGRIPVLLDGGIRRGVDVVKALSLGAAACLIGRPQLWGLAVAGEAGVAHVLALLRQDIDLTMGLMEHHASATLVSIA